MSFCLNNLSCEKGHILHDFLRVKSTNLLLPTTIINSDISGNTTLITAGLHGSEYTAIETSIRLSNMIKVEDIDGTLIIVHPVGVNAFINHSFAVNPSDNVNPNRVFPGDKNSSETHRLAYFISNEIYTKADFYLDLHGGDIYEDLVNHVYVPTNCSEHVKEKSMKLASFIDTNYIIKTTGNTSAYSSCAYNQDVPSILVERGSKGLWCEDEVKFYLDDCLRVLKYTNNYSGKIAEKRSEAKIFDKIKSHYALCDGMFYPSFSVNCSVKKGDKIGVIKDFFGNEKQTLYTDINGIILYQTISLSVNKKMHLVAVLEES